MNSKKRHVSIVFLVLILMASLILISCQKIERDASSTADLVDIETLKSRLVLETEKDENSGAKVSKGTFAVFEDRDAQEGRMIHLDVVVLHASTLEAQPDPVFVFAGGPGGNVATYIDNFARSWIREQRDVVLVSQRGTGGDNRLDCDLAVDDDNLQSYFDPLFRIDVFRTCLDELKEKFDLTKYSTCLAADDYNEVRQALGYDKINITGASYGTRMALVYMRRHPETVRTSILKGVAPIAFKNPLFHAPGFQQAIHLLIAECANDPDCRGAYPNLEEEYGAILDRLEQEPAIVNVEHPVTDELVSIKMSREAFIESLRTVMYSENRQVPYLIHQAFEGDYAPFAQVGLMSERRIRRLLAMGMLLCVTCAEDLDRITEDEIIKIASNTDMGDGRVRRQKAVCEFWPRSEIPDDYEDPVSLDVPVLLISGTLDPVTPPQWGEESSRHLPNSLHLVVPGAHGVNNGCLVEIQKQFLDIGTVEGLDISCTEELKAGRFRITKQGNQ
jgi:pimeloyl-ACP methyl ester carboxylesterase